MPSPFPGMDPYLEQFWGDMHHRLITYACDQIQGALPSDLRARVEERVFIDTSHPDDRSIVPDIRIVERGVRRTATSSETVTGTALAEPLRISIADEPVTEGFIEIVDIKSGRRVVTVVEVLSPANKARGRGRDLYRKKQRECRRARVNLVEIDLLRGGRWVLTVSEGLVPASHRTPFGVCVARARSDFVEYYRAPLRERLPRINIPLRSGDADVPFDLQALLDHCYEMGRYGEDIDYEAELTPPLNADDARWADELLRNQQRRRGTTSI